MLAPHWRRPAAVPCLHVGAAPPPCLASSLAPPRGLALPPRWSRLPAVPRLLTELVRPSLPLDPRGSRPPRLRRAAAGLCGQLNHKSNMLGKNMTKPKTRLHNRNVSCMSRSSQDVAVGSSDENNDDESSKTRRRASRRGRRKVMVDTSEEETQIDQINSEGASPEDTKKVKRRGRKKATSTTASSAEENGMVKEPKKRGRRKVKNEELSDGEVEDLSKDSMLFNVRGNQIEEHVSVNDLEKKIELLYSEDIEVDNLMPLVCCFGPAKYSFIPSGRPATRLIDHEIHDRMKDVFWTPNQFVRAPGGSSSNVALALAAIGSRVEFMGKLGDDEYGQSLLYHLNINGVQTRAVILDPSAPTDMSLMKVTGRGSLKTNCAKPCAEDCFLQSDINPAVLKEHGIRAPGSKTLAATNIFRCCCPWEKESLISGVATSLLVVLWFILPTLLVMSAVAYARPCKELLASSLQGFCSTVLLSLFGIDLLVTTL